MWKNEITNHPITSNFIKSDWKHYVACFGLSFLPAALFILWLFFMKITGSAAISLNPTISDELFWYHQITAMVDSGMPLGYYGYNGTHALYGTFGPWGIAILLPYALWGKLFGFGLTSMCCANTAFLGLSLCLFALLTRLTSKQILFVAVGYCTLLMNLFYSASSMAEPLRWSMAMVLTGCMIRIYRKYCGKFFQYLIVPLLLFYCGEAFMLLALFLPVYLILVLPIKNLWMRLITATCITGVLSFTMRKLLFLVVSPLYGSASEPIQRTLMETILEKIRGVSQVLFRFTPASLWENRGEAHGFFSLLLLFFLLLLALTLWGTIHYRKTTYFQSFLLAFFLLLGALGGYCLIYKNPSLPTICRGLNTAIVCAVLLLSLHQNKKIMILFLLCVLLALPSFYLMYRDNLETRTLTEEENAAYKTALLEFDELFDISPEHSRWENTIAQYGTRKPGMQTALALALPRSAGYNGMLKNDLVSEAKYAVVYRSFSKEKYRALMENLKAAGYSVIYKQKALTILSRDASAS